MPFLRKRSTPDSFETPTTENGDRSSEMGQCVICDSMVSERQYYLWKSQYTKSSFCNRCGEDKSSLRYISYWGTHTYEAGSWRKRYNAGRSIDVDFSPLVEVLARIDNMNTGMGTYDLKSPSSTGLTSDFLRHDMTNNNSDYANCSGSRSEENVKDFRSKNNNKIDNTFNTLWNVENDSNNKLQSGNSSEDISCSFPSVSAISSTFSADLSEDKLGISAMRYDSDIETDNIVSYTTHNKNQQVCNRKGHISNVTNDTTGDDVYPADEILYQDFMDGLVSENSLKRRSTADTDLRPHYRQKKDVVRTKNAKCSYVSVSSKSDDYVSDSFEDTNTCSLQSDVFAKVTKSSSSDQESYELSSTQSNCFEQNGSCTTSDDVSTSEPISSEDEHYVHDKTYEHILSTTVSEEKYDLSDSVNERDKDNSPIDLHILNPTWKCENDFDSKVKGDGCDKVQYTFNTIRRKIQLLSEKHSDVCSIKPSIKKLSVPRGQFRSNYLKCTSVESYENPSPNAHSKSNDCLFMKRLEHTGHISFDTEQVNTSRCTEQSNISGSVLANGARDSKSEHMQKGVSVFSQTQNQDFDLSKTKKLRKNKSSFNSSSSNSISNIYNNNTTKCSPNAVTSISNGIKRRDSTLNLKREPHNEFKKTETNYESSAISDLNTERTDKTITDKCSVNEERMKPKKSRKFSIYDYSDEENKTNIDDRTIDLNDSNKEEQELGWRTRGYNADFFLSRQSVTGGEILARYQKALSRRSPNRNRNRTHKTSPFPQSRKTESDNACISTSDSKSRRPNTADLMEILNRAEACSLRTSERLRTQLSGKDV